MFTVLIPLYNKAAYIQRALDSVYAQTCQPGEILVVNDGATDGSDAIVRRQENPLIRVLDQPNQGVSIARNNGLAAATQPFIAFLDADDRWRPGFLAAMKRAIEAFPAATLYGSGFATVAGGRVQREFGIPPGPEGPTAPREIDYFRVCTGGHPLHMSTTVVPRPVALEVGGLPIGIDFCDDHIFWAKLALKGAVVMSPTILAEYDVAVPGQAVERWKTAYKSEVLEYHRFLARELRANRVPAEKAESFRAHGLHVLRQALLQRLYWGNFQAVRKLDEACGLADLELGWAAGGALWLSNHPSWQPVAQSGLALARGLRKIVQKARGR
jgi:glycosyltransferase involved in cell wall biosynthesis